MNQESTLELTRVDRAILESYKTLCDGLSAYLGDGYELVLHSLENYDHSVIKIINGYHTGRAEGAPITDLALDMLDRIRASEGAGHVAYFAQNKKGEPLKSTTITIPGEGGRVIGLLCINFYLNTPFSQVMANYQPPHGARAEAAGGLLQESFVNNAEDLICQAVNEVRAQVQADPTIPAVNKNKEIVARLWARGIFKLKDAVQRCADILGISKNTVYMHLRNMNGAGN